MVLADDPIEKKDEPENEENTTPKEESNETAEEVKGQSPAESEEEKAEEPAVEEKPVEPVAEEPVAEEKAVEPVAEAKAEKPVAEEKAKQPVAEEKAKEPAAEEKADEPVAEEKDLFDVSLDNGHIQIFLGGKTHPKFSSGDTITVHYKIKEGNKERIQQFKGVVLQRKGSGTTETVTIRKVSGGIGVERILPLASPYIDKIEVHKRGKVRRARIFYLRDLKGKGARITEKKS